MARHVALLRAINLGSRNRVPMPALRDALVEAGYEDVATVVQSGNIALTAPAKGLAADLRALVRKRFDVDQPVIVRTAAQWRKVVADNPLDVPDGKRFQVLFFDRAPRGDDIEVGDERAVVRGREVYCWHPGGLQRSPLSRQLGKLDGDCTARNWNTVLKLEALL